LMKSLKEKGLPVKNIVELKEMAEKMAGKPRKVAFTDRVIGIVEYRNGEIIDKVYQAVKE